MDRRLRKAEILHKDIDSAMDGVGEFLGVADEMLTETETYPVRDQYIDMEELDDDEYNEIVDSHRRLNRAFARWSKAVGLEE